MHKIYKILDIVFYMRKKSSEDRKEIEELLKEAEELRKQSKETRAELKRLFFI